MVKANRWLLPEGVEEILPRQAWQIENYRRQVLDLYRAWGYELVIPPMIEYSESLLIGMGSDIDLQSFKLTDQLSGRTLALRADITPQTARIDAHSWQQEGPTRLCYAGSVVHTLPKSQLASREPLKFGAELYGEAGIEADLEVITLMLKTIALAGVEKIHLDLGHVGIYRALLKQASLDEEAQALLFDAFDRKAEAEIKAVLSAESVSDELQSMLSGLVTLHGGEEVLAKAEQLLAGAGDDVKAALAYLKVVSERFKKAFPDSPLYIDLAELRGYQYHTGLVFAAYVDGLGHAVANGGRYDGIGEAFGRARPATGFSLNVKALLPLMKSEDADSIIVAPLIEDEALAKLIDELRTQGMRVSRVSIGAEYPANCNQVIVKENDQWQVKPLTE